MKNIIAEDGEIVMVDKIITIRKQATEHNGIFWARITAKVIGDQNVYIFAKSYHHEKDRDSALAKAWHMISAMLPAPLADFSKPIRPRKR